MKDLLDLYEIRAKWFLTGKMLKPMRRLDRYKLTLRVELPVVVPE
jgi:hypothetical protein